MQIILESLSQDFMRQMNVLTSAAVSLTDKALNVTFLENIMDECGYTDNGVIRITCVNIGITEKRVQLIVKYIYEDADEEDDKQSGTFYITSPELSNLSGEF